MQGFFLNQHIYNTLMTYRLDPRFEFLVFFDPDKTNAISIQNSALNQQVENSNKGRTSQHCQKLRTPSPLSQGPWSQPFHHLTFSGSHSSSLISYLPSKYVNLKVSKQSQRGSEILLFVMQVGVSSKFILLILLNYLILLAYYKPI